MPQTRPLAWQGPTVIAEADHGISVGGPEQEGAATARHQQMGHHWCGRGFQVTRRNLRSASCLASATIPPHRTFPAAWPRGGTDQGSQFHDRLVPGTRLLRRHQLSGDIAQPGRFQGAGSRRLGTEPAGKNAPGVSVHRGHRLPGTDAGDGTGRVGPDPGQREPGIAICRQPAAMLVDDGTRRPMQQARPSVVTKAGPESQHLLLGGRG